MDSSPRTPSRRSSRAGAQQAASTPGESSASKKNAAGANAMDTSDMSEPLAQPLPASPGPSPGPPGGPPSEASSTSMLAPTPGAGKLLESADFA